MNGENKKGFIKRISWELRKFCLLTRNIQKFRGNNELQ